MNSRIRAIASEYRPVVETGPIFQDTSVKHGNQFFEKFYIVYTVQCVDSVKCIQPLQLFQMYEHVERNSPISGTHYRQGSNERQFYSARVSKQFSREALLRGAGSVSFTYYTRGLQSAPFDLPRSGNTHSFVYHRLQLLLFDVLKQTYRLAV